MVILLQHGCSPTKIQQQHTRVHIASCWVSTTQVASLFCIRERGGESFSALRFCQGLGKQGWQAKAKAKTKAGAGRQCCWLTLQQQQRHLLWHFGHDGVLLLP